MKFDEPEKMQRLAAKIHKKHKMKIRELALFNVCSQCLFVSFCG
jgi:hypothetical protein